MKKLFIALILTFVVVEVSAQVAFVHAGNIVIELKDGTKHEGVSRSNLFPNMTFVEISDQTKGPKVKYSEGDILRVIQIPTDKLKNSVKDTTIIVPKVVRGGSAKKPTERRIWLQQEFLEHGLGLYSCIITFDAGGATQYQEYYYGQWGDDVEPLPLVSTKNRTNTFSIKQNEYNRNMLAKFFELGNHADFAERIRAKEFNWGGNPIDVIKIWEEQQSN